MPEPAVIEKAELREIEWDDNQQATLVSGTAPVVVQFNPETMSVSFSNQKAGGDQRGGSAFQYVGQGTTKLALDLWFDITRLEGSGAARDVRELTQKIAYFITPKKVEGKDDEWIAPGVRFLWGSFLFEGVMDSMNEKLEFFSEDGRPLRAMVSISLSSQQILFKFNPDYSPGGGGSSPGATPLQQSTAGDTAQGLAAAGGKQSDWKSIAAANDIENPRSLPEGAFINLNLKS